MLRAAHTMNDKPKTTVSVNPTTVSAACGQPTACFAMSEPKPGSARFVAAKPRAVWTLGASAGAFAEEVFIRTHQSAHGEVLADQDRDLRQQLPKSIELEYLKYVVGECAENIL